MTRETAAADFGERQPQRELLENGEILSRFVGLAQRELALRIVGEPSSDGHRRRSEIAMTLALRGPRLTLRWFWTGKRGASRQTPDAEFGRISL